MRWTVRRGPSKKACLYATFDIQDLIACKFSHRRTCLYVNICMSPNFLCSISTIMFPHKRVVYETYHIISYVISRPPCFHAVCWPPDMFIACSHTKRRDVCTLFLTYEVMSMCNFKHITPRLSHNFPQVYSKQSTTSRLFNLWTLPTMQVLTYKGVSVCKLSHTRTCLCVTWHLISHVVSRPPCVRTKVPPTRRIHAHFWLMKTRLCVTFNT